MAKRTKKTDSELRTFRQIHVPVSVEEKKEIELRAKNANLSVAGYLRSCGLGKRLVSKKVNFDIKDLTAVNRKMASAGNLLKLTLSSPKGYTLSGVQEIIDNINACRAEIMAIAKNLKGAVD